MQNQQLGAHELMEIHEVLSSTINGINQFQLYQPHCQDSELQNIIQNQLNFMTNEYNSLVSLLSNKTGSLRSNQLGSIRTNASFTPTYGLQNPSPNQPNTSIQQLDDRDIASGMLGCSKSSATLRMHAALECADPTIRQALIQGSKNCAEQAYETWQYMNRKGYYQVPTLKDETMQTFANMYQPISYDPNQVSPTTSMQPNQFQTPLNHNS